MTSCKHMKVCALAFALGITWGLGILLVAWIDWWTAGAWGAQFVQVISSIYIGYQATFWGGVIGFLWAFADLFIAGLIVGWIYNGCCSSCKKCE